MKKILLILGAIALVASATGAQAQEGLWKTYSRANSGLLGDSIVAIGFDGNDSLWLAAWQGTAKQSGTGWRLYNTKTDIPSNDIADIVYTNNILWFGHGTGISAFDGTTWTTYTVANSGLVNAPIVDLAADGDADLWIATQRGLGRFTHDKVWSSYKHETVPAIPYNGIQSLAVDASNSVWMSFISTAGLVVFPAGNSAEAKYIKQDSIPGFPKGAVYIKCLAVDESGNLWAGTGRNGIVRINASGATVFSKQTTSGIPNDTINSIAVDHCGNVWVATENGAAMFDGTTWYKFIAGTGQLENNFVYTIEVDGAGHVWFGTKGGITEFKPLPNKPTLLLPAMQSVVTADSVYCKWNWDCPNILQYWFEIADNPDFTNSTIDTLSPSLLLQATALASSLKNNTTYYWRIKAMNDAGWSVFSDTWNFSVDISSGVGMRMEPRCTMDQNFPNPCNSSTTVRFMVPRHEHISLAIYDVLGRHCASVLEGVVDPGLYTLPLDLTVLPQSGLYIYTLTAGDEILRRTMQVVH